MRKIFIYTLTAAFISAAISCKNSNSKGAEAYSENSGEDANEIIAYTNAIVDLSNSHNKYLERMIENTDKYEKGFANPDDPFAFSVVSPILMPTSKEKDATGKPAGALSNADQKFFKENVAAYMTVFERIKASNQAISGYISAEDYKDDKGAKGKMFIDSIRNDVELAYTIKDKLMDKVSEVADASEAVILKDSPLKDYILAMKSDIKAVRKFIDLVYVKGKDYKTVSAELKIQYDALEAAHGKHEKIDLGNAKKAYRDTQFTNFNNEIGSFLGNMRKLMRNGTEKGELTESDVSSLESDYNTLITFYNSFNS